MEALSNRVWFTRKARIYASERLLSYNSHSQIILIYYSLVNVALSIAMLTGSNPFGDQSASMLVMMSIGILVISLVVSNVDFKGRALKFKDNYINLQRLYEKCHAANLQQIEDLKDTYVELLKETENHKSIDDMCFRVSERKNLTSRIPCWQEIAQVYLYYIFRWFVFLFLYASPFLVLFGVKMYGSL